MTARIDSASQRGRLRPRGDARAKNETGVVKGKTAAVLPFNARYSAATALSELAVCTKRNCASLAAFRRLCTSCPEKLHFFRGHSILRSRVRACRLGLIRCQLNGHRVGPTPGSASASPRVHSSPLCQAAACNSPRTRKRRHGEDRQAKSSEIISAVLQPTAPEDRHASLFVPSLSSQPPAHRLPPSASLSYSLDLRPNHAGVPLPFVRKMAQAHEFTNAGLNIDVRPESYDAELAVKACAASNRVKHCLEARKRLEHAAFQLLTRLQCGRRSHFVLRSEPSPEAR